jgi:hypothetical protein
MATVHFPTRVQNESNIAVDYLLIVNYKFTKYTVFPIYNGLSDHDAQLLTITNYLCGAEQYSRGHQMLGHSIVSQHFMEPEGSILVPILSQTNLVHITPFHLSKIHPNIHSPMSWSS